MLLYRWFIVVMNKKNISKGRNGNICKCLKPIILLAQIFGLFPVTGNLEKSVHFKFKSWKMLHSLAIILLAVALNLIAAHYFCTIRISFLQIIEFVFNINSLLTSILFVHLAKLWPQIMRDWSKVDAIMERNYGFPRNLPIRINVTAMALIFFAAVEHFLSLAFHVVSTINTNGTLTLNTYYYHVFPQMFHEMPLNYFTAMLVQTLSAIGTFSWNYSDLFIIIISSALAVRFKQVSKRLDKYDRDANLSYWIEIREDYDRLCNLTRKVDDALSLLVLKSFGINIFFILIQLFNSLRLIKGAVEEIYFFYSFGFLILRTISVSLYAAWINDESKEPIHILNSLPPECYNEEVRRFIMQISSDPVALTGCKVFPVTRGLILNLAGAIVTYELVLIQFNLNAQN